MARYRKRPVEVEAIQYTGGEASANEIVVWIKDETIPRWYEERKDAREHMTIRTLEGTMVADIGDYIIKGVQGEFYPCKPDIFEQTYDKVEP